MFDSYFLLMLIRLMKCLVAQVTAWLQRFIATRIAALKRTTPLPGYSTVSGIPRKIRRLVAPPRACFKVKIEACKLFAKFVHSPFGRLIHTFITNLTIYYKCWLFTTNVVCQLVHFTTTSQNPGEPQVVVLSCRIGRLTSSSSCPIHTVSSCLSLYTPSLCRVLPIYLNSVTQVLKEITDLSSLYRITQNVLNVYCLASLKSTCARVTTILDLRASILLTPVYTHKHSIILYYNDHNSPVY